MTPIIVHRRVFGQRVKDRVVATGHVFMQVVIVLLALIIVGISTLIFSVVIGWDAALAVAAVVGRRAGGAARRRPLLVARANARA